MRREWLKVQCLEGKGLGKSKEGENKGQNQCNKVVIVKGFSFSEILMVTIFIIVFYVYQIDE